MKRLTLVHSRVWRKCRFRVESVSARLAVMSPGAVSFLWRGEDYGTCVNTLIPRVLQVLMLPFSKGTSFHMAPSCHSPEFSLRWWAEVTSTPRIQAHLTDHLIVRT